MGRKSKYDWDSIIRDYQKGVSKNDICEKYNVLMDTVYSKMYLLNVKRPHGFIPERNTFLKSKRKKLREA